MAVNNPALIEIGRFRQILNTPHFEDDFDWDSLMDLTRAADRMVRAAGPTDAPAILALRERLEDWDLQTDEWGDGRGEDLCLELRTLLDQAEYLATGGVR